jgi:hypothetical protein
MKSQNFANHARMVPMYHGVLFLILLLTLIGSFVNLYHSWGDHQRIYSASLIVSILIILLLLFVFCRVFALKAQDRAIRAEENLRHFVLTGKLLDTRLSVLQIVALRFAPDEEFVELARRAAEQSMAQVEIKKAIRNWKADYYRV